MKTRTLVFNALCAAILVISKEVIAFLPNVELVSFFLIMFALFMPLKDLLLITCIFCIVQAILYGFGDWLLMYFIIWNLLVCVTYRFKNHLKNEYILAFYSGAFGLVFGFLFSLYYLNYSLSFAWAYFLRGLPFDFLHAIFNFIIMLLLAPSFKKIFQNISAKIY